LGREVTEAVLANYETAPIDAKLRATLGFLRKLTLEPEAVTAADVQPLLAAGVTKNQVRDAIWVTTLFNIYTRLADTLGWYVPGPDGFSASARMLLKRGYAF
jgi:alkylhydroperoxidase family enzyme